MLKKRVLFEWALLLGIMGIIYFGGWQAEVVGFLQRGLLLTGFMNPDHDTTSEAAQAASYDLSLVTLDGKKLLPETLKNKVVFMNIWATWCPPCVAEMPGIHQLYQSLNKEEVIFVMLSVDDDREKLRRFVERKGYTFQVYLPAAPLPEVYQSSSIPTTFVISPEGKIVFKKEGMANYDTEEFRQFLKRQKVAGAL